MLHDSPVFGPVRSRRLGTSLGINLLPGDGKVCSFDCIYCECGLREEYKHPSPLPTREEVREALEAKLQEMLQSGEKPDVLTFAGNGEPTMHPFFARIVEDVVNLRDRYFPEAKISVLSNGTRMGRQSVMEALCMVDLPIMKLDTVSEEYIRRVNRPSGEWSLQETIDALVSMGKRVVVQTMFLCGEAEGRSVDNTGAEYVDPWLETLRRIGPRQVMIYTIARKTPMESLKKASPQVLDAIARRVEEECGTQCSVGY